MHGLERISDCSVCRVRVKIERLDLCNLYIDCHKKMFFCIIFSASVENGDVYCIKMWLLGSLFLLKSINV